ncbi:MAG TPA: ATP-binding protein [Pyrinomonadaceae bacterium]|nr:ATP-binding protein [Pyrinomonadaceae bacterium]
MIGANQQQVHSDLAQLRARAAQVWSEGALRFVFERSRDAILLLDHGVFIDCNQAAVDMLRANGKDELLSLSPSDLSPAIQPDGTPSSIKSQQMNAVALERGSHRFEWLAKRRNGSEFPVEVLLTAIPFQERQILYVVWRDISRRKETERELSKSREVEDAFRAGQGRVLEMIAQGATLSDVLASLVTLIEAQSEGMICSVLQLSEDGKYIRHGAAPRLPEIYVQAVNGAPIGPKNGSCGTAMYRGQPVIVTDMLTDPLWEDYRELAKLSGLRACWSTPIFTGQGKVLGSFAMYYREPQAPTGSEARLTQVATHIAGIAIEHERAQNELLHTRSELAHVARVTTMGELAASIAHEVNQPLGAIVGNADICLSWLRQKEVDLKQVAEALEDIASDGHRASQIISRIRSLVKKHVPEKAPLNLSDIASEVISLVRYEAQRKQVIIHSQLGESLPAVEADRVQLQQVLLNLVMNGIEAMHETDATRRQLTVQTVAKDGNVLTAVSDRGIGIEPAKAERLFKPFHTTKAGGMGMGLAISRTIIESFGGKLSAESNAGGGAIFSFSLPARTQAIQ